MKALLTILQLIWSVYFTSADPNLFGSRKRRKAKEAIAGELKSVAGETKNVAGELKGVAGEFKQAAGETQKEIDLLKARNPFESAASKSAMAKASQGARQMQTRMLNQLGAGASPEALIASQQAVSEAQAAAAGQIATGAEAQQTSELARLRAEKQGQMGAYASGVGQYAGQMNQYAAGRQAAAGAAQQAASEIGSGWTGLFQSMEALGSLASGAAQAGKQFLK